MFTDDEAGQLPERRVDMPALLSSEKRTQILLTGIGTITLAFAGVLWYVVQGIATQLHAQGLVLNEVKENSKTHNEVASLHIEQIGENKADIRAIRTNASARKDPFTGSQGVALRGLMERNHAEVEEKLDDLELRVARVESNCEIIQYRLNAEVFNGGLE